ncbi:hypothetical protein UABAM_02557 [Candidatus Uabimicrobium amorphum]|uniref:PEP-CTERM protein-sorting domain-containing protein n=1 Tax=Uabimicrobium amorphum TaxID=2596890 RepID=A0A5S9IMD7_UABAM|nr:hypothetical protein UABAM_02557 [Candidatus Uabimicrobium amorphum]
MVYGEQFTIDQDDIFVSSGQTTSSYTGPVPRNTRVGSVIDGGLDAFDFYGFWGFLNRGLSLERQVDTLTSDNVYRFVDTFTNTSESSISETIRFVGRLGSNSSEKIALNQAGIIVSFDDPDNNNIPQSDPVIAHIFGNNPFLSSMNANIADSFFDNRVDLVLNPGESITIMHMAFLARDLQNRVEDVNLAITQGLALQANPIFTGLSSAQINSIVNFDTIPEPHTYLFFILGGFLLLRCRQKIAKTL